MTEYTLLIFLFKKYCLCLNTSQQSLMVHEGWQMVYTWSVSSADWFTLQYIIVVKHKWTIHSINTDMYGLFCYCEEARYSKTSISLKFMIFWLLTNPEPVTSDQQKPFITPNPAWTYFHRHTNILYMMLHALNVLVWAHKRSVHGIACFECTTTGTHTHSVHGTACLECSTTGKHTFCIWYWMNVLALAYTYSLHDTALKCPYRDTNTLYIILHLRTAKNLQPQVEDLYEHICTMTSHTSKHSEWV